MIAGGTMSRPAVLSLAVIGLLTVPVRAQTAETPKPAATLPASHPDPADVLSHLPPDDSSVQALALPQKADYYVQTRQWIKLSFLLQGVPGGFKTKEQFRAAMEWMGKSLFGGGPVVVAFPQAAALWSIGSNQADPEQATKFKDAATTVVLYALAISNVDSTKCEDQSVKGQMIGRILHDWQPQIHYLASLPPDHRQSIIDHALAAESKTATQRADDYSLCSQGNDELKSRGTAGSADRAATPPNPDYVPKFRTDAEAAPLEADERSKLPLVMAAVVAADNQKQK